VEYKVGGFDPVKVSAFPDNLVATKYAFDGNKLWIVRQPDEAAIAFLCKLQTLQGAAHTDPISFTHGVLV
jgi:hypothetical protein